MALFGRNKKTEVKEAAAAQAIPVADTVRSVPARQILGTGRRDVAHILSRPRITEKATMHQDLAVYTFDIADGATKRDVMAAVRAVYKVMPRKVAVVPVPSKARRSMRTGMRGASKGGRKAYVYLKKGETMNIL